LAVTINVSPAKGGDVEADGASFCSYPARYSVERGGGVRLEAIPRMDYHFVEWVGELVDIDDPNDSDLVIDQVIRNMSLTAVFAPDAVEYTSRDGLLSLLVPVGTEALDENHDPIDDIDFDVAETPPLPDRVETVGRAYELEPSGATFDSPVSLVWNYDSGEVPPQVDEEYLTIAYYDQYTDQWTELPSEVDPAEDTIAADVTHLSLFAILAHLPLPPPLGTAFTTTTLNVSPTEVGTGETTEVSVLVSNTGQEAGSGVVSLKIDGVEWEAREIVLEAGAEPVAVVFTVSVAEVGTHAIEVNGLSDSLTVTADAKAPLPPSIAGQSSITSSLSPPTAAGSEVNWNVIAPIIVGVFLAIFIPVRMRSRRGPLDW
jgi:hypothetical protein